MNSDPFTHPLDRPGFDLRVGDRFVEHHPTAPGVRYLVEIGARRGDRRDRYSVELITLGECDDDGGNLRRFDGGPISHTVAHGVVTNTPEQFVRLAGQKALAA